jgi:hypothetical protein
LLFQKRLHIYLANAIQFGATNQAHTDMGGCEASPASTQGLPAMFGDSEIVVKRLKMVALFVLTIPAGDLLA